MDSVTYYSLLQNKKMKFIFCVAFFSLVFFFQASPKLFWLFLQFNRYTNTTPNDFEVIR